MTAKEWLNRGRNLNEEINALIKAKEKALYDACNVSIAYDKVYKIKQEILKAVSAVDNSTYRALLIERYINFKTWEQIADYMNYSRMHVTRLHGRALQKVKML